MKHKKLEMGVTFLFTVNYFNHLQPIDILRNKTTRKYNIVEKERLERAEMCC